MPTKTKPKPLAWHYTPATNLQAILEAGYLDPERTVMADGERSILWFSTNQFWEATAQKAMANGAVVRRLGMAGTYDAGNGLVRFGVPRELLSPWPKIGKRAGMDKRARAILKSVGEDQGAIPRQWHGTFKRVPVKRCVIETFDGEAWQPMDAEIEGGES